MTLNLDAYLDNEFIDLIFEAKDKDFDKYVIEIAEYVSTEPEKVAVVGLVLAWLLNQDNKKLQKIIKNNETFNNNCRG